jgi:hypothetical protein
VIEDQANYYITECCFFSIRNTVYDKRHLFTLAGEDEVTQLVTIN